MKISIQKMAYCAIFAALTAVLSQIAIPIPMSPVPINLAMFSVFMAGGLLGTIGGTTSQVVYVLLGIIGVPVFAKFSGGLGVVVGPTGGYIIGYIAAALVIGLILKHTKQTYFINAIAMIAGLFVCYLLGTAWFMFVLKWDLVKALMACVVPFLIGDALKIILAAFLVQRLRKIIKL